MNCDLIVPILNINDLAHEASISNTQLLSVLNNEASTLDTDVVRRLLNVVRKYGLERQFYELTNRIHTIGVFVPHQIGLDFVGNIAQAVTETAAEYGYAVEYHVQRAFKPLQTDDFLDLIGNKGAIVIASDDARIIAQTCLIHNCPYVLIENEFRENLSSGLEIVTNNRQAIQDAVNYLIGLGHQQFAYLTGNLDNQSMRDRLDGYQMTLRAAGIPYDRDWIIETNWRTENGYEKSKRLFVGDHRPTAVLCGNDMIALGVMRAAGEAGLIVGQDVSVIGFDDLPAAAQSQPPLTTLQQPMRQMGEMAFVQLLNMMHGHMPYLRHLRVSAHLIVRGSTGPAPHVFLTH
ncbi:MAG: substrate-binding domain-containing protein [Chloroflexi bacterium]|nr:substrate-binding domain-containing protein [Chloroflexota bacterium]MCC6892956.1 substrate-binding domain-containing protein [Anaerolineae bacterium]